MPDGKLASPHEEADAWKAPASARSGQGLVARRLHGGIGVDDACAGWVLPGTPDTLPPEDLVGEGAPAPSR